MVVVATAFAQKGLEGLFDLLFLGLVVIGPVGEHLEDIFDNTFIFFQLPLLLYLVFYIHSAAEVNFFLFLLIYEGIGRGVYR